MKSDVIIGQVNLSALGDNAAEFSSAITALAVKSGVKSVAIKNVGDTENRIYVWEMQIEVEMPDDAQDNPDADTETAGEEEAQTEPSRKRGKK